MAYNPFAKQARFFLLNWQITHNILKFCCLKKKNKKRLDHGKL